MYVQGKSVKSFTDIIWCILYVTREQRILNTVCVCVCVCERVCVCVWKLVSTIGQKKKKKNCGFLSHNSDSLSCIYGINNVILKKVIVTFYLKNLSISHNLDFFKNI